MFKIKRLSKLPNLIHAFSTVVEGNMSFKLGSRLEVLGNREKFLKRLNMDTNTCVAMWVTHGDKVVVADKKLAGKSIKNPNFAVRADGLITNKKGLYLFLLIADCLPVILYDPKKEVLGLAHVGWKNANVNSIGKVVNKIKKLYKINPSGLVVSFGPAARVDSYIKKLPTQLGNPIWKGFIIPASQEEYRVDFVGLCKKQLRDSGVLEKNIFDCGIDTISDKRFFSHYRDSKTNKGDCGRFACVVGLK